jgi:hypothetical protein
MKRLSLALGALALSVLCAQTSKADTVLFDFSFTGSSFNGSGTFTTIAEGGNQYLITGITGVADNSAITGLVNINSNDNILYSPGFEETFLGFPIAGPFNFDSQGLSFGLANGSNVNLEEVGSFFSADEAASLDTPKSNRDITESVDIDVEKISSTSPVPEPGTLALFGTGVLGAAGAIRRRLMA